MSLSRFFHAAANPTPSMDVTISILTGAWPSWMTLPGAIKSSFVRPDLVKPKSSMDFRILLVFV